MIRNFVFCIALLSLLFSAGGTVSAFGENDKIPNTTDRLKKKSVRKADAKNKTAKRGDVKSKDAKLPGKVYVQVIVYDIIPGHEAKFEAAIQTSSRSVVRSADFINERVMRNVDELASQYASYAKFGTRKTAEEFVQTRLAAVKSLCTRTPETHLAELTSSYYGREGYTRNPSGREFGSGAIGQVAHLGLFIPFPKYRDIYDSTLEEVKLTIQKRNSTGYYGEDLLVETDVLSPEEQTPFTPRATVPSQMSINYGEYDTFENAEDSYLARNEPRNDPKITAMQRNFFSALQVPTRFYIFKVIANIDGAQKKDSVKTAMLSRQAK
jgi:hypothetical protein